MLKNQTVYGFVRDPKTSIKKASFPNGVSVEMRSLDGRAWFLRPESLLQQKRRKYDCPTLTEREKRWIDMLSEPWSGADVKAAIRRGYATD